MGESFDFQQAIVTMREKYSLDLTALALVKPESNYMLKWEYIDGNRNNRLNRITLKAEKGIAGTVFKTGKDIKMPDVGKSISPNSIFEYPIIQFEGLKSLIAIPLFDRYRVAAVLLIASRTTGKVTEETYEKLMEDIGDRFGPFYTKEMKVN
ncbi:GAF domain-containing protein [Gracilibacillus sp. HCP3S3_G5_1]|uniref:GAF domain-containing protein n=1 Tax=unclassified Gracilibacillus TaxID=2625209 RepID=UPI003F89F511